MRRTTAALLTAAALVVLPATAASAGKPGGGGSSSTLSLRMVDPADTVANHGDWVTFDVSTTATDKPAVRLDCYQGGTLVSTASAGFYPSYPWSQEFELRSGAWTGGAADCTATLYSTSRSGTRMTTLKTLDFAVEA